MKLSLILTLLVSIFINCSLSQNCPGRPANPSCTEARSMGRRRHQGARCRPIEMFYYNTGARQCRRMRYLGCLGNNNRHCTRAACERMCRR